MKKPVCELCSEELIIKNNELYCPGCYSTYSEDDFDFPIDLDEVKNPSEEYDDLDDEEDMLADELPKGEYFGADKSEELAKERENKEREKQLESLTNIKDDIE